MKGVKILTKLLISFFIVLTLFNFVYAAQTSNIGVVWASTEEDELKEYADSITQKMDDQLGTSSNIFALIAFWGIKLLIVPAFTGIETILMALAVSGGLNDTINSYITPLDIFFNKFKIIDINIFSLDGLDETSTIYKIRANVAMWYSVLLSISLVALIIVLLMNLIKVISKNTSIEVKANAKEAMKDWVVSFALVVFMNVIMVAIINLNELFVSLIKDLASADSSNIADVMDALSAASFSSSLILSVASLIVYIIMILQTAKFFLKYVQRFLTVLVLIFVAPLMPLAYSLNKSSGGKALSLNTWFKEFIYNVFIQTIDCILYVVMVGVAITALVGNTTSVGSVTDLGPAMIAIMTMLFIPKAEDMMKDILGFNNSQTINNNIVASSINAAKNGISTVAGAVGAGGAIAAAGVAGAVSFGKDVKGMVSGEIDTKEYAAEKLHMAKNLTSNALGLPAKMKNTSTSSDSNGGSDVSGKTDGQEALSEGTADATGDGIVLVGGGSGNPDDDKDLPKKITETVKKLNEKKEEEEKKELIKNTEEELEEVFNKEENVEVVDEFKESLEKYQEFEALRQTSNIDEARQKELMRRLKEYYNGKKGVKKRGKAATDQYIDTALKNSPEEQEFARNFVNLLKNNNTDLNRIVGNYGNLMGLSSEQKKILVDNPEVLENVLSKSGSKLTSNSNNSKKLTVQEKKTITQVEALPEPVQNATGDLMDLTDSYDELQGKVPELESAQAASGAALISKFGEVKGAEKKEIMDQIAKQILTDGSFTSLEEQNSAALEISNALGSKEEKDYFNNTYKLQGTALDSIAYKASIEKQAKALESAVEASMQMGDIDKEVSRILKDLTKEPTSDKSKEIKKAFEGVMQKRATAPKQGKFSKKIKREVSETKTRTETGNVKTNNIDVTMTTTIEGNGINTTTSHKSGDIDNLIKQIQSQVK